MTRRAVEGRPRRSSARITGGGWFRSRRRSFNLRGVPNGPVEVGGRRALNVGRRVRGVSRGIVGNMRGNRIGLRGLGEATAFVRARVRRARRRYIHLDPGGGGFIGPSNRAKTRSPTTVDGRDNLLPRPVGNARGIMGNFQVSCVPAHSKFRARRDLRPL